jgi:hypothetical protein
MKFEDDRQPPAEVEDRYLAWQNELEQNLFKSFLFSSEDDIIDEPSDKTPMN